MPRVHARQPSAALAPGASTPARRKFATLLRQMAQSREMLAAWLALEDAYRPTHAQVLKPLQDELQAGRRRWVLALDAAVAHQGLTPTQRGTLRGLVHEAAWLLLDAGGEDPELQALLDKHAEFDARAADRAQLAAMEDMVAWMAGDGPDVDEDDDDAPDQPQGAAPQRHDDAPRAVDPLIPQSLQEPFDTAGMANASEARVKQCNLVLADQLAEAQAALLHRAEAFRQEFGHDADASLSVDMMGAVLEKTRRQCLVDLHRQQRDLAMLGDVAAIKQWLKAQRHERRRRPFGSVP